MLDRIKAFGRAGLITVVASLGVRRTVLALACTLPLLLTTLPAEAQVGPWFTIGADGRVTTFDFTCHGDSYAYEHVMIHTSAGRRVLSFTQTCSSKIGTGSTLGNLAAFPTLLDTDGVIERIDVIGYQRYQSTAKHIWDFVRSTRTDTVDETIHAGNLVEQTNDSLEPTSSVSVYIYSSPPVP